LKIGVDVGGTNTDAVLMSGDRVLASLKRSTTEDVSDGIQAAIHDLLQVAGVDGSAIQSVMIGTTQFTNAFIQGVGLVPVAAIRIGFPAARDIPPFFDWPDRLSAVVRGAVFMVGGGHEFDGRRIGRLDEDGLREIGRQVEEAGLTEIAVTAIFSQINAEDERRAGEILREAAPNSSITLSHEIGRTGLLERENAALMNASLRPLARGVVNSYRDALERLALNARLYVSQNDGSLMPPERVKSYPVLTFAAGPTNSLRGAAHLSGIKDGLVVDIGGTTTDIGVLSNGFPRQSALHVDIGGVRTNFRVPDILSIGVGGGSRIRFEDGRVSVGPDSVGFRLIEQARVFGGDTLTATDVAVGLGRIELGEAKLIKDVDLSALERAETEVHRLIEDGVDRMKTSGALMPLVLVGGGAILVARPLEGVTEVCSPEHAAVANAVGAAIGQVSGEIDQIFHTSKLSRDDILKVARQDASAQALSLGADPRTLEVIELEELPLQYVQGGAVRVICRVSGALLSEGLA
jgi:N-methylhydantoinase A/oxoprolinase/acetone carboxylase beta subunit